MNRFTEILRRNSHPMEPVPTEVAPQLKMLPDVKAVLFDVYGTLLVSGSGDVGVAMQMTRDDALTATLEACAVQCALPAAEVQKRFYDAIAADHEDAKKQGTAHPEVVIEEIWGKVFSELVEEGGAELPEGFDTSVFALEFETRVNPVWPMPGFAETLEAIRGGGLTLGIVSNAQFFTPQIVEYFLEAPLEQKGFAPENCFFSYQYRSAKPGEELYRRAAEALDAAGIDACHILYVGNDMRNDILPASNVGMKTALYAGDQRSLRLRKDDARMSTLQPDVTLTRLPDILACLPSYQR